jgi:hypothetical protein
VKTENPKCQLKFLNKFLISEQISRGVNKKLQIVQAKMNEFRIPKFRLILRMQAR